MLYDNRLDVFLACARNGSFSKAAEELYLTPPGVMKQMSQLEADLKVTLFVRTHRGLQLTEAAKQLEREVKDLKIWCEKVMERIDAADKGLYGEIRIGTSTLTPPAVMADLWPKIQPLVPDLTFRLIPFENKPEIGKRILANLGEEIDVVAGFYDERLLQLRQCHAMQICTCTLGLGIPFGHPLWDKECIDLTDLKKEIVLAIAAGWSDATDRARAMLEEEKEITVETFDYFSVEALVDAINKKKLIFAFGIWNGIHPLLKVVPVNWDCTIQYGFFHADPPSGAVGRFLNAVRLTHNFSS